MVYINTNLKRERFYKQGAHILCLLHNFCYFKNSDYESSMVYLFIYLFSEIQDSQ